MALDLGCVSTVTPIPPVEAHTRHIPAGVVTLALEHRWLDAGIIREAFADLPGDLVQVESLQAPEMFDDAGLSVHVFETGGAELLRFDMFGNDPHYHYIHPGVDSIVVPFDEHANGPMWDWTVGCLRHRAREMLRYAGADRVAEHIDSSTIAAAVDDLQRIRVDLLDSMGLDAVTDPAQRGALE
jgi:hypothetical protein